MLTMVLSFSYHQVAIASVSDGIAADDDNSKLNIPLRSRTGLSGKFHFSFTSFRGPCQYLCPSLPTTRALKGTGVTYATLPMGADHTSGLVLPDPSNADNNPTASSGQVPVSAFVQTYIAAVDSLGPCIFASQMQR